jgi:[ribosomal protein S18]-alanine N-acetyltransferase
VSLKLRPVDRADLDRLARLHGQCFPEDAWDAVALAGILAMRGAGGHVAEENTVALGLVFDVIVGEEAEILTLCVARNERRRGIARTLLDDLFARAAAAGARQVTLEVAADNAAALSLYEATGFRTVGLRRAYYLRDQGDAVDAWLLRRTF